MLSLAEKTSIEPTTRGTPSILMSRFIGGSRVESFETYRPYLFSIAYRMLGSAMDAEDLVQETYLRSQGTPPETIRSLKAFLTTIITRLCVDHLQLARRKREQYMGPWLPEPILTTETAETGDPQERVDMQESVSLAFLVLLEQLQPFERAVFLLREVFEYEFAEIATMLDKSEAACRRSLSRAKQHLRAHRPRFGASAQTHRQLLSGYFQAMETGEITPLMNLLSENVTLWADGGVSFLVSWTRSDSDSTRHSSLCTSGAEPVALLSHKSQWMPGICCLSHYWFGRYLSGLRNSSCHPG